MEQINTILIALDDARLFIHQNQLYVSYREGPTFGYDVQVLNPIHIQFGQNNHHPNGNYPMMRAKVYASQTISFCCGRNMALLSHPNHHGNDHNNDHHLYSLTWVDPVTIIQVDMNHTTNTHPDSILFLPPSLSLDSTNHFHHNTTHNHPIQSSSSSRRMMITGSHSISNSTYHHRQQQQQQQNHHHHHHQKKIVYVPNPKPPQHTPLKEEIQQHHLRKKKEILLLQQQQKQLSYHSRRLSLLSDHENRMMMIQNKNKNSNNKNSNNKNNDHENYNNDKNSNKSSLLSFQSSSRILQQQQYHRRLESSSSTHKSHIHGTNGFMVPIGNQNEFLGIAHFHRPNDRTKNPFARFGHHYTHAFFMIQTNNETMMNDGSIPVGKLIALSSEFILPSYHHPQDGHMIQFLSGLEYNEHTNEIIIAYGINDCEAAIISISYHDVVQPMLRPVSAGQEVIHFMKPMNL
jgi:hypothetical protein